MSDPDSGLIPTADKISRLEPFKYRDFRLLWFGAMFSFFGSWIQSVAQGWLVYDLTRDEQKLVFVAFAGMLPVSLVGPLAGALVDRFDKRKTLVACQSVFGINALLLAYFIYSRQVEYWHILVVAVLNGFASALEMPTRQSLISAVVPKPVLSTAVPLQALTFNLSRVMGPAIGGILLKSFGAFSCYLANGLSYLGLIVAVLVMRADLSASKAEPQPIYDLLTEGLHYTFREARLRMLFLMETTVSVFGLAYIPLIPAFAEEVLKLGKDLGQIYVAIGVGSISGLLTIIYISQKPWKSVIVRLAMTSIGVALVALSFAKTREVAYPLFAVLGFSTVVQFNTTNTLFQLIAPPNLRGRALAMHIWALSGSAPIALPLFGWLAHQFSVGMAVLVGGTAVVLGATFGWLSKTDLGHDPLTEAN